MLSDGKYIRERRNSDVPFNSQEYFYAEAYKRLEDKSSRKEQLRRNREKSAEKKAPAKKAPARKTAGRKPAKTAPEKPEKAPAKRGRPKKTK
jgi:polyphosphate kinase